MKTGFVTKIACTRAREEHTLERVRPPNKRAGQPSSSITVAYIKMNSIDLNRKLNSVGKAVFVDRYQMFEDCAKGIISRQQCVDSIVADGISNDSGALIRTGNAMQIFASNGQRDALTIIANSRRVPFTIVNAALNLLAKQS